MHKIFTCNWHIGYIFIPFGSKFLFVFFGPKKQSTNCFFGTKNFAIHYDTLWVKIYMCGYMYVAYIYVVYIYICPHICGLNTVGKAGNWIPISWLFQLHPSMNSLFILPVHNTRKLALCYCNVSIMGTSKDSHIQLSAK